MPHHFVLCTANNGYEASLELRKLYEVLEDNAAPGLGMLRVIDESGERYLYPKELFLELPLSDAIEELIAQIA